MLLHRLIVRLDEQTIHLLGQRLVDTVAGFVVVGSVLEFAFVRGAFAGGAVFALVFWRQWTEYCFVALELCV